MPEYTGGRWTDFGGISSGSYDSYFQASSAPSAGGVVTWSMVASGLTNQSGDPGWFTGTTQALSSFLPSGYEAILQQAFAAWSSYANIEFVQIEDDGSNVGAGDAATIRVAGGYIDGDSGYNTWGWTWFPWTGTRAGDVVFDSANSLSVAEFTWIALHEIGHALGLDHTATSTVMNGSYAGITALQPDDIAGITALYGVQDNADGNYYLPGSQADLSILSVEQNLRVHGNDLNNVIRGGDGTETLIGGAGNDTLSGGISAADRRDVIYGGAGDDIIDGGYGNDELRGDAGNDQIAGGFGADTVIGGAGDDILTGSAFSDLLFGGDGMDFVNGGFGHDRVNGGADADRFFHIGIRDHGSDWIQDYNAAEGDTLLFGIGSATGADFRVTFAHTASATGERAGDDAVEEAFVIYSPTGQIMWALVDGAGQDAINIVIGGVSYDLLAGTDTF